MNSNFHTRIQFFVFLAVNCVHAEEYNLFGEPGQGYAVQVNLGHPQQKLNLIIDTGSATLAVASHPQLEGISYFCANNSSSVYYSGKTVHAKYSQSNWEGKLVSDFIQLPSLPSVPEVRTELALITKSSGFFVNKTQWQENRESYDKKNLECIELLTKRDLICCPTIIVSRFIACPDSELCRTSFIWKDPHSALYSSNDKGLLGLAYLPVGATGDEVIVESWLDSIEHASNKPISFLMKLCGIQSLYNTTHNGNFQMIDDAERHRNSTKMFQTPVLRKSWYEVGVLSIKLLYIKTTQDNNSTDSKIVSDTFVTSPEGINEEMCRDLNRDMTIVDSGTTNIKLPDVVFRQVVDELRSTARSYNIIILDEFWYRSEAACWPEPQEWHLPWLAIDLLSAEADNQYFTLEIPPQNYMRLVSSDNSSKDSETLSEYCYKLGLDTGGRATVLGYTAMEGFEVLFNRSSGWIGWQTSDCGPKTRISGPFNHTSSLITQCQLTPPMPIAIISIKTAQWALCAMSIIAGSVLVYLLAPCVKSMLVQKLQSSTQISLSQAALVAQDSS